ncbi:type II toxin-antitoxin system VapC family toxin [Candidatus Palauibacter sp.]|uniref:type II toxin-antitoxin system VapC family toxin n=1 Tax=Candidatus Palauibacter sp. TaxID=3101350 RepID=UPI003B521A5C
MRRLLLDTHVFLWCLSDVARISDLARSAIVDPRNEVFVSAITGWEIEAKRAKGRLDAPEGLSTLVEKRGFTHLPLEFRHAEEAARLPVLHRDPFDRFLIAQARVEGLTLVTRDRRVLQYDVPTMAI